MKQTKTRVRVSPLENKSTFKDLDEYGITYIKEEKYIYTCELCDKIYQESVKKCPECDGSIESCQLADIRGWNDNYGIEIKKDSDLLSSFKDDRIFEQLKNLAEVYGSCAAVVFVGTFTDVINGEKDRLLKMNKNVKGLSTSIAQLYSIPATCTQYGVSFIQVETFKQFVRMLKYFDYKCGAEPKIRAKRKRVNDKMPGIIKTLTGGIKGIGTTTALRLYSGGYRSIEELIQGLKHGDITTIKHIGNSIVDKLERGLLRGED